MGTQKRGGDDLDDPSLLDDDNGDEAGDDLNDGDAGDDLNAGDDAGDDGGERDGGAKADDGGDDAGFVIELAEGPDAAGPDNGALGDEDEKEGKEEYGKKVRERVAREQRIARNARASAENERNARIAAETRAVKSQQEALALAEAAIDTQIRATTSELRKAKEDGKTDDEITHQTSLSRLHAQHEGLARSKQELAAEDERVKNSSAARGPSPLAQEWKSRNPWYGHDRYGEQTALTGALDRSVKAAGYDINDPEYYAELDRRIRRRMPELQKFQRGGQQQARQPQRRDPAGAVVRRDAPRGGGEQPRKGVIRLSKQDQANMRAFGIDLNDPKAVKEYAMNKMGGARG